MKSNHYNNVPMGIGAALARNPQARRNFALASQQAQNQLIDCCSHCNSFSEMCDVVNAHATQHELQQNRAQQKQTGSNFTGHSYDGSSFNA